MYVVVDLNRISAVRQARLSKFFRPNNFRLADTQSLFGNLKKTSKALLNLINKKIIRICQAENIV